MYEVSRVIVLTLGSANDTQQTIVHLISVTFYEI